MAAFYLALLALLGSVCAHFQDDSMLALLAKVGVPHGYIDCSYNMETGARGSCVIPPKQAGMITIACVGDSITAGGWPQLMQANLNTKYPNQYNVINFGECGSTLQRSGDSPYVQRGSWPKVLASNADIIIIMLGTNDAKDSTNSGPLNWENTGINSTGILSYEIDYNYFITTFKSMPSSPTIFAAIPPPLYKKGVYGMDQVVINNVFPLLIPQIARGNALSYGAIDVFDYLGGVNLMHPEWSSDGCHPNAAGYAQLALAMQAGIGL